MCLIEYIGILLAYLPFLDMYFSQTLYFDKCVIGVSSTFFWRAHGGTIVSISHWKIWFTPMFLSEVKVQRGTAQYFFARHVTPWLYGKDFLKWSFISRRGYHCDLNPTQPTKCLPIEGPFWWPYRESRENGAFSNFLVDKKQLVKVWNLLDCEGKNAEKAWKKQGPYWSCYVMLVFSSPGSWWRLVSLHMCRIHLMPWWYENSWQAGWKKRAMFKKRLVK